MGKTGFLYDSMKDQLKWHKLSIKKYIKIISQIGQILSMRDEDYQKAKRKELSSSSSAADALISAFGE